MKLLRVRFQITALIPLYDHGHGKWMGGSTDKNKVTGQGKLRLDVFAGQVSVTAPQATVQRLCKEVGLKNLYVIEKIGVSDGV
jgi:hypothetical protein